AQALGQLLTDDAARRIGGPAGGSVDDKPGVSLWPPRLLCARCEGRGNPDHRPKKGGDPRRDHGGSLLVADNARSKLSSAKALAHRRGRAPQVRIWPPEAENDVSSNVGCRVHKRTRSTQF